MGGGQSQPSIEKSRSHIGSYAVDKFNYDWKISNFRNRLSNGVGNAVHSDVLTVNLGKENDTYKLVFYPNGYNERVKGYASLYLEKTSNKERLINFSCTIVDAEGRQLLKKSRNQVLGIQQFLGWVTFCPRNILLEDGVLKDDILLLECSLHIFDDKALINPETVDKDQGMATMLSELSTDFGNLVQEGNYHDFTLIVQNEKFQVHKAILSTRSPVFKALLNSPLTDKSFVKITDISKPIFKELLNFIYSGNVSHLNVQEASELYYAADKYELITLKNQCAKVITANLEVDNVLNALLLGDKHSDLELKEVCIQYIVKNASNVQEQKEWSELFKNQHELAQFVVKRIVSNTN